MSEKLPFEAEELAGEALSNNQNNKVISMVISGNSCSLNSPELVEVSLGPAWTCSVGCSSPPCNRHAVSGWLENRS